MHVTEQSLDTAEQGTIGWTPTRRRCASGCLLTVEDMPADYDD